MSKRSDVLSPVTKAVTWPNTKCLRGEYSVVTGIILTQCASENTGTTLYSVLKFPWRAINRLHNIKVTST